MTTYDPKFPMCELDRLINQAVITLNLPQTSRVIPKLLAYAYTFGMYHFNKCPLVPHGTKVIIHCKPTLCNSWGYHGYEAWYEGPILDHYRSIKCRVSDTGCQVDVDTLTMLPTTVQVPAFSGKEALE
eukprot:4526308-Ditylum_brightwellii.AAC.1